MQFQTYEKYKASGIDWLGEIPEGWEVKRLKDLGFLYSGLSGKKGEDFLSEDEYKTKPFIPFTNIANNQYIKINDFKKVVINKDENQNRVKKNDLFFLMSSEGYEDIGKNSLLLDDVKEVYLNSFCKGFRFTNKEILGNFVNYLLLSDNFRNLMILGGKGFTRINLPMGKINNFSIIIPNKQTQTTIANYLDKHTALIDKKIELLKAKKQSYTQLKQTLINEVVTKGLDTTVEMKDSGIEWIGQIPKHWEMKRLKDNVICYNGGAFKESLAEVGLPIIKIKQLVSSSNAIEFCNPNSNKINKGNLLKSGDLLFSWSTLLYPFIYKGEKAVLNQHIFKLKYSKNLDKKFLYYKLISSTDILKALAHGSTMKHIMKFDFDNLNYSHPPKQEQIKIANYLDEKTQKIDDIIQSIDKNIERLKEFRKTLINDAVTGKIKVA